MDSRAQISFYLRTEKALIRNRRALFSINPKNGDFVTKEKKQAAIKRSAKLLQRFAKNHELKTQIEDHKDLDSGKVHYFRLIRFGNDAVITDPSDDPLLVDIWGSEAALTRDLINSRVKEPLILTLFRERKNSLYESIGFDVSSYSNGSGNPDNPNSSNWGRVLDRVGLRYFDGDDGTISLLFPSRDKASVALALALAGSFEPE